MNTGRRVIQEVEASIDTVIDGADEACTELGGRLAGAARTVADRALSPAKTGLDTVVDPLAVYIGGIAGYIGLAAAKYTDWISPGETLKKIGYVAAATAVAIPAVLLTARIADFFRQRAQENDTVDFANVAKTALLCTTALLALNYAVGNRHLGRVVVPSSREYAANTNVVERFMTEERWHGKSYADLADKHIGDNKREWVNAATTVAIEVGVFKNWEGIYSPTSKKGSAGIRGPGQFGGPEAKATGLCDNDRCRGRDDRTDPTKVLPAIGQLREMKAESLSTCKVDGRRIDLEPDVMDIALFGAYNGGEGLLCRAIQETKTHTPTITQIKGQITPKLVREVYDPGILRIIDETIDGQGDGADKKAREVKKYMGIAQGYRDTFDARYDLRQEEEKPTLGSLINGLRPPLDDD